MKPGTTVAERIFPRLGLGIRLFVSDLGGLAVEMFDAVGTQRLTYSIRAHEFGDDARADYANQIRIAEKTIADEDADDEEAFARGFDDAHVASEYAGGAK